MTSIWVAEAGWAYLNAVIDCCTRRIAGWSLELRCRAEEAEAVVAAAVAAHGVAPGQLTLGTDNGSAYTARRFRAHLGSLGVRHRRGGYRDPESQAFIESWLGKLKEREVCGPSTRRSKRPGRPSPPTSPTITIAPTPARATGPPTRSPRPGPAAIPRHQTRPEVSTAAGSRSTLSRLATPSVTRSVTPYVTLG